MLVHSSSPIAMDTSLISVPLPSVKSSVKLGSSYSSSASPNTKRSDVRMDADTPQPGPPHAPSFVRLGSLNNDDLENELSQRSATISFWFPRRAYRTQRPALARNHTHRRHRALEQRDSSTAIQRGTPIDIFALKKLGLLLSYVAIGYFDGVLPLLARVLYKDASSQAFQLTTVRHAVLLVRLAVALLSDTVLPASNHRRRVWLIAGWLLLLVLCVPLASFNIDSTSANQYLSLLLVLPIGPMVASVSANALMVEYAHREDIYERGSIQMLLLATRTVGELIGRSFMSTGNPPAQDDYDCQGELDCVVAPKYIFLTASVVALGALLCAVFLTHVPSRRRLVPQGHPATTPLKVKLGVAWSSHQRPVYSAFLAFGFLQAASLAWSAPRVHELATRYVQMSEATESVSDSVGLSFRIVAALLMMSLWRNTSWRVLTLVLIAVSTVCTRVPSDVLVLLNVTRSHTLFLAFHHVASLAEHLMTMIRLLVAVEMTSPTMEATSFALTTSAFDLGTIVGSFASTRIAVGEPMATAQAAPQSVSTVCALLHVLRVIVDIGSLKLLPIQKDHVQEQLQHDGDGDDPMSNTPTVAARVTLGSLLLLLLVAVVFHLTALIRGKGEVPWINNTLLSE